MSRLLARLRHMVDLTPRETWRLARGRLPLLRRQAGWTAMDLLASQKHRHGIRFAELLLRQEAIVRRHMPWEALDFGGAYVVEIGCGPLGGFGPLAIFCGAASFESAEPEWDPALFACAEIAERYLAVLHADLVALYGERMDFSDFQVLVSDRIRIHRTPFAEAAIARKADIVLSQSCLEHVFPLEATIEKLARIQSPGTRFLHLVDFGNHYLTPSPFDGLYEQPPEAYIARRGRAINLARAPDVAALFAANGIEAKMIASRVLPVGYHGQVHPWWRERYDAAALFTQLALIAGPAW